MILVGCIGTVIATISFFENVLLFYVFAHSRILRKRSLLYLTCLSVCDIFISISYIGIMSIQVTFLYAHKRKISSIHIL